MSLPARFKIDPVKLLTLFFLAAFMDLLVTSIGLFAVYPDNRRLTTLDLVPPIFFVLFACIVLFRLLPELKSRNIRIYQTGLFFTIPTLIASLANVDWAISRMNSDNFHGLATKWDAVYFTVITMATAGYGDIFPKSQLARIWVSAQVILGVLFIGLIVQREIMAVRNPHKPTKKLT